MPGFLWAKALHIIFLVTWFAGLFYLPRLFVYHALSADAISCARFKIMERKLYYGITTPGALCTLGSGIWLASSAWNIYKQQPWLHFKLLAVAGLVIYHIYLGYLYHKFKADKNTHSHVFYRLINEVPVLFLVAIVVLVVVKPEL